MKPLKITMTAFGPYKDKEVIDFSKLKGNRLFVISGKTGAGKTTIFDAISFALYGSASGEDRNDSKLMRSDFAADDVHTAVELEFELNNTFYRIKRQLSHIKKGNKSATGESYEFYEKIDGREVPCVDRQMVSEINKKVESLIGLTKDQFSQIVMLPQGEFRKLLTSETVNKEEILRKIFKTEPYLWISERLKEKKKEVEEDFKSEKQTRNRFFMDIESSLPKRAGSILFEFLSQEHFNTNQVVIGIQEEADFYQHEIAERKEQSESAEAEYNKKLEEYHKAEALNEKFLNLADKVKKLQDLTGQAPIFAKKEKQLERAERASKIESYEIQVNVWREDEKRKKQQFVAASEKQKNGELKLEAAQKNYALEENNKAVREDAGKRLDRYNDFLPTVKEIAGKKAELHTIQNGVQRLASELETLKGKNNTEKSLKEKLNADIRDIEGKVDQLPEKQQKLSVMRDQARVLQEYLKFLKNDLELQEALTKKEADYQAVKKQYESLEGAWVNGQASLLAAHLHNGMPCPVCGSIEHPHKAAGVDAVPTKEELEDMKVELQRKNKDYLETNGMYIKNREQLDTKAKEVSAIGFSVQGARQVYDQLVSEGKSLGKEVELFEKERRTLIALKQDLDKKEKVISLFEKELEEKAKAHQEQNMAFETKKAVYQEQVNRIPEEIRTLSVLEQKIAETALEKKKLEGAWEHAQEQLQSAQLEVTKTAADLTNARSQLEDSTANKERLEKHFAELLEKADFSSETAYLEAKMSESGRVQLNETINQFKSELAAVNQRADELQTSLKDKTKPDMTALEAESGQLKKIADDAGERLRQANEFLQKALELKAKISDAEKRTTESEKQLAIVTDLYDVVRGQNTSKISFERYLQIEFLEQIIIAANERLKHLSNGQFLLKRSERQESRGKQSGLGLDVYDAYTGQTRDVKTLSGGEKFNASLCLALGMADVIQSYQGGVSIDTMFIDEGFGSLDEESLNKAIDTLIDLQKSGRMIGVISHVQELKDSIPAILEVEKTKEGCSKTKFVIK